MSVEGNARLPAGIVGILQAKKAGYPLDTGAFWLCDKCRIIAEIGTTLYLIR